MSDGVIHLAGTDAQIGSLRRQRCLWCGQLLIDDDLSRMSWPLKEDGTDPGPPGMLINGDAYEVIGDLGSFRGVRHVPMDEWPDSADPEAPPGAKAIPANCCANLDPEVTR